VTCYFAYTHEYTLELFTSSASRMTYNFDFTHDSLYLIHLKKQVVSIRLFIRPIINNRIVLKNIDISIFRQTLCCALLNALLFDIFFWQV